MEIKDKLAKHNFQFKHKFGQNFVTDGNLLRAIVEDSGLGTNENVLEIGTGAGTLTKVIASKTQGKILTIEVDTTLRDYLTKELNDLTNVSVLYGDILKLDIQKILQYFDNQPFRVIANLPYYISTPIIFYLVENNLPIQSITVMLQKELAERICAKPNCKDYGGITVVLGLYGKVTLTRIVPRSLFNPRPNVDSAVINIEINQILTPQISQISKLVKISFAMRRKTLVNNLMQGYNLTRTNVENLLNDVGLDIKIRAENVTPEQFIVLSKEIKKRGY